MRKAAELIKGKPIYNGGNSLYGGFSDPIILVKSFKSYWE